MRTLLTLLAFAVAFSLALVVLSQIAAAGSPEAPEIVDPEGDCASPYGNAYLDLQAAWIGAESADAFEVHARLARFDPTLAEGAGVAVQFVHQGLQWGTVGFYSVAFEGGWAFWTGQFKDGQAIGFEESTGSFDAAEAVLTIAFPKGLFSHSTPDDTTLREFSAITVDARPAYPAILLSGLAPTDPDDTLVVCDTAASSAIYVFTSGLHSAEHAATLAAAEGPVAVAALEGGPPAARTPLGPLAAAALALAALRRR